MDCGVSSFGNDVLDMSGAQAEIFHNIVWPARVVRVEMAPGAWKWARKADDFFVFILHGLEGFRNFFLTPLVSQQYQIPTCVLECIRDFSDKLMNLRALNIPSSIY